MDDTIFPRPSPGFTIWLTGLPNSGKSTIASLLVEDLRHRGLDPAQLDGNELRRWLSSELGFSAQDREIHVLRSARLAALLNRHGVWSVVSIIAPFRSIRQQVRRILGEQMILVYLRCPLEVLVERDDKNLYAPALAGEIEDFTGVSSPYEEPVNPQLRLDTDVLSPEESAGLIVDFLADRGLLFPRPSDRARSLAD